MKPAYLKGLTSLPQEITEKEPVISGQFPAWLNGTLFRVGPGQFEVGQEKYRHWFDGHALLHRFSFSNGKVEYLNRFMQTRTRTRSLQKGRIAESEFGTDPCKSVFAKFFSNFSGKAISNTNVNIARLDEQFIAMTESPMAYTFDPRTLESKEELRFSNEKGGQISSAHPHFNRDATLMYSHITEIAAKTTLFFYERDTKTQQSRRELGRVPMNEFHYMHSFAITENYIVFVQQPWIVSGLKLLFRSKSFFESFEWKPEQGCTFWVLDRHTGKVRDTFKTEAFFVFHHINAFEREDEIVVDLAAHGSPEVVHKFLLDQLCKDFSLAAPPQARRFILNTRSRQVTSKLIADVFNFEMPSINYEFNAREYRYFYGQCCDKKTPDDFNNQLAKVDIQTGQALYWREEGCYPSEPVFVSSPEAGAEDDGVILSLVLNGRRDESFLLVLNASTFAEMARATVPHPVPFTFHGNFYKEI